MMRVLTLLLVLFLMTVPALADERILLFYSEIEVFSDGSMQVTETIRVRAEGGQIKRGIYRDFPTDYKDRYGNRYRVEFKVVDVTRDGQPEGWHTKTVGQGVRVYMGQKDHRLSPGEYCYRLTYRTDRQLGFFEDHDELYWNVTGNDWAFPIDVAGARVSLPGTVRSDTIASEAYTGHLGARGQDYRTSVDSDGVVNFDSTRSFGAKEGMTIVVSWPKGHVAEPTPQQRLASLLSDNSSWVVGLFGILLLLGYYTIAWLIVGRDPEKGVIITRYEPPAGLTPASARFVRKMEYDHKAFAAALVNLAVKGLIEIKENDDGEYSLVRTKQKAGKLAPGEKAILTSFFGNRLYASITLRQTNHSQISDALESHEEALRKNSETLYFLTNQRWLWPGVLLSLLSVGMMFYELPREVLMGQGFILSIWLTFWTVAVFSLGKKVWHAWRAANTGLKTLGALMVTLFAIPFFGGECVGIWLMATQVSPSIPVVLVAMIILHFLFHHLLKAPTRAGRLLLDKVDGFRDFLDVAEREEMNFRNPPEKTPELFERYLPFALALDVEQHWMERFAGLFARLENQGEAYRPTWYRGHHWHAQDFSSFSNALGSSLGAALATSSTAPGSSSGSGGGGFSGGGGGGGGGGGW